jgi:hypothetical protein
LHQMLLAGCQNARTRYSEPCEIAKRG